MGKHWLLLVDRLDLEGDISCGNLQVVGKPVFIVGWFVYWIAGALR
jgi:hypothetical protein